MREPPSDGPMAVDPMDEPAARTRLDERAWLPFAAFAFVVLALVVLTLSPALVLRRVAWANDRINTTVLPAYDALRDYTLALEQQASAARGQVLTGHPRYAALLDQSKAAETAALRELQELAPRISPSSVRRLVTLRRYAVRRDSLEDHLREAGSLDAYRAALPQFDLLHDSMLVHLAGLEEELVRVADARAAEEARGAARQRTLSLVLGAVAVLAALLVGWFAWSQRRLRWEVQRALDEAERRRQALERVTESRSRLMRGFSHDVKNPLGAADGYLQLLADGIMGPLTEAQLRSVRRSSQSIRTALSLVEDLLELARAETGNLAVSLAPTDLREVVRDVAEEYRAQAEANGLTLAVCLPDSLPPVITDGRRVRQVLGNLISNAVKYTREGGVTIRLDTPGDGAPAPGGGRLAIAVEDTGPGIAAEQRHLLFQEFVRLDPAAGSGAGVGLVISRRIAEALGGEIAVESEVGRGSTFTLRLPVGAAT